MLALLAQVSPSPVDLIPTGFAETYPLVAGAVVIIMGAWWYSDKRADKARTEGQTRHLDELDSRFRRMLEDHMPTILNRWWDSQ